jgi:hypothetical protein
MRIISIVNLCLWAVLFIGWAPYSMLLGFNDPVSVEIRWILAITAALQLLLVGFRMKSGRPVLG